MAVVTSSAYALYIRNVVIGEVILLIVKFCTISMEALSREYIYNSNPVFVLLNPKLPFKSNQISVYQKQTNK